MVGRGVIDLGLERMHHVLELLGHPERFQCPIVHITGTNGKGSVAEMVASGLSPKTVGIFTSPFLVHENDAIRVFSNGSVACISADHMHALEERIGETCDELTNFEILVLTALVYFQSLSLDAVVIEVGMGGARDATNVFSNTIAVVTSIGLDHQKFLGSTIEEICAEKCAIFTGIAIVNASIECMHIVEAQWASKPRSGKLIVVDSDSVHACPFNGAHQPRLMHIAIEVIRQVDPEGFDNEKVVSSIQTATLPGRLENRFDPIVGFPLVLDGAHNVDSASALRKYIEQDKPITWIISTSEGREEILPILLKSSDTCVCTEFKAEGAVSWVQPALATTLAVLAGKYTPNVICVLGLEEALRYAQSQSNERIVVAGSLYLVRDYLRYVQ